jgi:hypothetical protein
LLVTFLPTAEYVCNFVFFNVEYMFWFRCNDVRLHEFNYSSFTFLQHSIHVLRNCRRGNSSACLMHQFIILF